jgi:hypothetical protein
MSYYVSGLLTTLLVLNQSLSAAPPISKQVKQIQTGAVIQVQMADGRTLEGKLVSNSQQSFDLLEEILLVGGMLAATGAAIAVAGSLY